MGAVDTLISKPNDILGEASATNATCTVTLPAAGPKHRYRIDALGVSVSAAPTTTQQAVLAINGATYTINLPAALFAPMLKPLTSKGVRSDINEAPTFSVAALGAGVICTLTVFGTTIPA